ncbi:MAG: hypothetical protein NTX03_13010, partial [Bacteroidetes bacterium]|nr:hypothetical protein [Bacteroidota bacterium]
LFNCFINPMISFYMYNVKYRYEEIDPFYFGYSSAVYNNYKSAITLGTAFVTRPRGKGNNIMTARNRSQQLTTIQIKAGVNDKTKSCIILNAYEDYLVFTETELGQIFADNRDRYYTGGGSLQFRYNQFVKFKFFSDVYTGNSYKDQFNRPDLITEDSFGNHGGIRRFFSGVRRASRYSYQDDGQPNYNRGRSMLEIDYTPAYDPRLVLPRVDLSSTTISLLVGVSGGAGNMWLQNAVHNSLSINKKVNGADKPDRFHRFYVGKDKPSIFIMGAKTDLNFFKLKQ